MAVLEATAGTIGSLGAEARVAGDASESRAVKLVAPKGQTSLPEGSQGMVGAAVRPWSPPDGALSYGERGQGGGDRAR